MRYIVFFVLLLFFEGEMRGDHPRSFFYDLSSYVDLDSPERLDILYELLSPDGEYRATVYFYKNRGGEYWSTLALFDGPRINPPLENKTIPLANRVFAVERSTAFSVRWIDEHTLEIYYYSPFSGAVGKKEPEWKDVKINFVELIPDRS